MVTIKLDVEIPDSIYEQFLEELEQNTFIVLKYDSSIKNDEGHFVYDVAVSKTDDVRTLRDLANNDEKTCVLMPAELTNIIEHKIEETALQSIEKAKVLRYMADMLEV